MVAVPFLRFAVNIYAGVEPIFTPASGAAAPAYEHAVNPDIAVRVFPGTEVPFLGVGDSIVRANYMYGNGLAINGSIMIRWSPRHGNNGDCVPVHGNKGTVLRPVG